MKPKTMILMVVAVACGLGASYMTSRYLKAARPEQAETEPTRPVLVAKVRIAAWTPIKEPEKQFEVKSFPESVAPRKALASLADIKDQRLKSSLEEGKPVTQDDLLAKEQLGIAELLKPGQRAVAIKVTPESIVGGFVLPGTRVDIVCTTRGTDPQSKVILQNMLVMAVDTQDTRGEGVKTIMGQNVTLAATPEEATRLTLGQSIGDLRLMLKSQGDVSQIGPVVTRWKDLDEPLGGRPKVVEEPKVDTTPQTPPLPPVIEDEPKKEEPKVVVKPPKPHTLVIENGLQRSKHTFHPTVEEVDEPTEAAPERPGPRQAEKAGPEAKKEAAKPEAKKDAAKPAQPGSTFSGRSTRTGRVK